MVHFKSPGVGLLATGKFYRSNLVKVRPVHRIRRNNCLARRGSAGIVIRAGRQENRMLLPSFSISRSSPASCSSLSNRWPRNSSARQFLSSLAFGGTTKAWPGQPLPLSSRSRQYTRVRSVPSACYSSSTSALCIIDVIFVHQLRPVGGRSCPPMRRLVSASG